MEFDHSRVERVLGEIEGAMRARAQSESRHLGARFNLFSVLARYGNNDERYIHTPFLGTLLDPAAEHDLGDHFLRSFLVRVQEELPDLPFDSLSDAYVTIEDEGVDIRIALNDLEIIIENKIHAQDQGQQLIRYIRGARHPDSRIVVIYLTLRGTAPSQGSIGTRAHARTTAKRKQGVPRVIDSDIADGETPVPIVLLSYQDDVLRAIETVITECQSDRRYNSAVGGALEQYSDIVHRVLGETNMQQPSEEAAILMERSDNLAIGLKLQCAASEAYGRRVAAFLLGLDKCFNQYRGLSVGNEESGARQGAIVRRAEIPEYAKKMLEPEQVENGTTIWNWVTRGNGNKNKEYKHLAMLWYGVEDGHWAFSVELAQAWIFLGFVRLSGQDGEGLRIQELSAESEEHGQIPVWDRSANLYGRRHAGAWQLRSLVRALAEVPRGRARKETGVVDKDDPYGIKKLFAPEEVFRDWVKPVIGRTWSEIVREAVGNRKR